MSATDPLTPDEDNPEWDAEMFARARLARDVLGDAFVDRWNEARERGQLVFKSTEGSTSKA